MGTNESQENSCADFIGTYEVGPRGIGLTGGLRPVSAGEVFNCAAVHAALSDPEASAELQLIIEAIPNEDWPAGQLLARSYWPAASRWPVASRLSVAGDTSR